MEPRLGCGLCRLQASRYLGDRQFFDVAQERSLPDNGPSNEAIASARSTRQ